MHRIILLSIPYIFLGSFAFAQPQLKIFPEQIEFKNKFDRIENVYFINSGNEPLTIDTITYKQGYYFIRFNREWNYPQVLQPGDTVKMDCILGDYAVITSNDTADTMSILDDRSERIGQIRIKIDYYEDEYLEGIIEGQVTDSAGPVNRAKVYFIYSGSYIIHSEFTDQNGEYSAKLPPGYYLVAVQKDSYYVSFYKGQFDPFDANRIILANKSSITADFQIQKMINTGNSISGTARDLISNSVLRRGTIVARRGRHTPNKVSLNQNNIPDNIYVSFINYNGNYRINNILNPGYFYIQTFSDYYIPAYYNESGSYPSFWQQADSLYISGSVQDINFVLQRDSSTGSGMISGRILNTPGNDTITDITVLALSLDYNQIFNFAFGWEDTSYEIRNLPYGRYKLIGEKLGFGNAITDEVTINPDNPSHTSIDLIFTLAGIKNGSVFPERALLYQNYPNPFNPSTNIRFYLPEAAEIKLIITDVLGEEVARLYDGFLGKGEHQFVFSAEDYSSGIYFIRLSTPQSHQTKKILLLK
jgi:hypothetical protein